VSEVENWFQIVMAARAIKSQSAKQELGYFIRRSQVLQQYRQMIKAGRLFGRHRPEEGNDIMEQIRTRYRLHKDEQDPIVVKQLITEGRRQLELLKSLADDADSRGHNEYTVGVGWPWERSGGGQGRVHFK